MPNRIRAGRRADYAEIAKPAIGTEKHTRTEQVLRWIDRMGPKGAIVVACSALSVSTVCIASLVHHITGDPIGLTGLFNTAVLPFVLGVPTLMVLFSVLRQLESARAELARLSTQDVLTGILNRRSFLERAESAVSDSRNTGLALSVALIDADHFKNINDQHGHLVGDETLRRMAQAIQDTLPENGSCGRLGGEEFGVLLPGLDHPSALAMAEDLRAHVQAACSQIEGKPVAATLSIGVASAAGEQAQLRSLLSAADDALYDGKHRGRNQVVSALSLIKPR